MSSVITDIETHDNIIGSAETKGDQATDCGGSAADVAVHTDRHSAAYFNAFERAGITKYFEDCIPVTRTNKPKRAHRSKGS